MSVWLIAAVGEVPLVNGTEITGFAFGLTSVLVGGLLVGAGTFATSGFLPELTHSQPPTTIASTTPPTAGHNQAGRSPVFCAALTRVRCCVAELPEMRLPPGFR